MLKREEKVEIVAIGNEILQGKITNTNASYLSESLAKMGIPVGLHLSLPDDKNKIVKALSEALDRSMLVITTGGLGPTIDDLTIPSVAEIFDSPLAFNQEVADDLKRRFGSFPISLENQATLPTKAKILPNKIGTASGLYFEEGGRKLIVLPGVPYEMRHLFETQVTPLLKQIFNKSVEPVTANLLFANLTEGQVDPSLRDLFESDPDLELGIYPSLGLLTLTLKMKAELKDAKKRVEAAKNQLRDKFKDHFISETRLTLEEAILDLMTSRNWTLSLAESCTGGSIAARLVSVSKASRYFLGSLVCYSNQMKQELLNVSPKILEEQGAVSELCAKAMLKGLLEKTGSDWGVSITGIAGPDGGTKEKPVGTVWIAIGQKGKAPLIKKYSMISGDRTLVIERSVNAALSALYLKAIPN